MEFSLVSSLEQLACKKDSRGVLRGRCTLCGCSGYDGGSSGKKCLDCGHVPGKHEKSGDDGGPACSLQEVVNEEVLIDHEAESKVLVKSAVYEQKEPIGHSIEQVRAWEYGEIEDVTEDLHEQAEENALETEPLIGDELDGSVLKPSDVDEEDTEETKYVAIEHPDQLLRLFKPLASVEEDTKRFEKIRLPKLFDLQCPKANISVTESRVLFTTTQDGSNSESSMSHVATIAIWW